MSNVAKSDQLSKQGINQDLNASVAAAVTGLKQ